MTIIDPSVTWTSTEARLAQETDPILRRNLELLLQHQQAEATLDLDALMATVSEDARYHSFDGAKSYVLEGKQAVREFYERFAASGAHRLQHEIERLVVDRNCILTEGVIRIAYPGSTLAAHGTPVDDPDALYLYESRMAIIWPIGEDGLFIGEDSYVDRDGFAGIEQRKLSPDDVTELRR